MGQILRKLEERGADLDHLQEMQEKDIGVLIRYAPGGRVFFCLFVLKIISLPPFIMLKSDFLLLKLIVGQTILELFPVDSVVCYSKSNHQNCSEGNSIVNNLFRFPPSLSLGISILYILCFPMLIFSSTSQVDLLITPDFVWKDRFHGSSERWWILVEVLPCLLGIKAY